MEAGHTFVATLISQENRDVGEGAFRVGAFVAIDLDARLFRKRCLKFICEQNQSRYGRLVRLDDLLLSQPLLRFCRGDNLEHECHRYRRICDENRISVDRLGLK